jgi:crossover junction endodeoxyribonuclease RuvC
MTMRILGIDPGLRTTGFGVVDLDAKGVHYVASEIGRAHV